MKTLFIVRHAKSSWDFPEVHDYERPLNTTGKQRTEIIIDYLKAKKIEPDLIISSHAVRANETARLIASGLNYPEEKINIMPVIYEGDEDDLLMLISDLPDDKNSVMIVGHNPTITRLSNHFLEEPIEWMPTTGVVCIEFKTDRWKDMLKALKKTKFVISPKLVREGKVK